MEWQVLESKMLSAAAYDAAKRILYLRFRSGDVYRYFEFPSEQHKEFLEAESRGKYFLARIRGNFSYERLAKLHAA